MNLEIKESAFELPIDWKLKTLGDISNINMGQSPSSSAYNDLGNGKYLIQGNADIKNRKTVPRTWTTEFPKVCQEGDILMTVRAPVGAIARSLHNACLGRGVCAITSDTVDNEYLYQFLLSYETKWAAIEQGSTFTAVNGKDIRGIEIPLPPLPEQQKIAEILSTVDEKMAIIDEQLAQIQELKKGLMQRLLTKGIGHTAFKDSPLGEIPQGWGVVRFEECLGGKNSLSYGILQPGDGVEDGVPMLRTVDLAENGLSGTKILKVPQRISAQFEKTVLRGGEVLFSIMGTLGRTAVVSDSWKGWNVNRALAVIRLNEKVDKYFFSQVLKSQVFQSHIVKQSIGSAQMRINLGDLRTYWMPLPSLPEQHQIAEILTTVDDKLQVLIDKKAQYQELKRGLMQQLLTGQRRVRVAAELATVA